MLVIIYVIVIKYTALFWRAIQCSQTELKKNFRCFLAFSCSLYKLGLANKEKRKENKVNEEKVKRVGKC